jgi:RNA-binding protein 26
VNVFELIPPRSDADPAALADYIIALLKHEKPPAELKSFCAGQLVDFLHGSTGIFD